MDPVQDLKELFAFRGGEDEDEEDFEEEWEILKSHPVYETIPDSISQHWIFTQPTKLLPGKWKGFALMQVLRMAEPNRVWEEGETRLILNLSDTMTQMRRTLLENPLQTNMKQFLLYLSLLRKIRQYFHNNASPFDSPFPPSGNQEGCSLFLYEYINMTIVTLLKHYHSCFRVVPTFTGPGYKKEHVQHVSICLALLEEVRQKVSQVLLNQESRETWEYQTSPDSLGSKDDLQFMMKSMHAQENERIRRYVKESLGGDDSLQTRISLLQIKRNEIRIAILLENIASMGTEEKLQALYEMAVPFMRNITISYDLITKKHESHNNYLVYYTQFMSFYWVLLGDLKLAQVDWECYQMEKHLDFDTIGKRALKRLEVALFQMESREDRMASLRGPVPDFALEKIYQSLKSEIKVLEGTIRPIIQTKLNYKSGSVNLRPIEQKHFDSSITFTMDMLLDDVYREVVGPLEETFQLFERVKHSPSLTKRELIQEEEMSEKEVVVVEERGDWDLFEERKEWLEFLLDQKEKNGEIVIGATMVRELEAEYRKILEKNGL